MNQSRRPKNLRRGKNRDVLRSRVLQLRQEFPTWGKRKIARLLRGENIGANESAVGRIITQLIGRNMIASARMTAQRAGMRTKAKRPYAKRLKRGQRLRSDIPGQAVQIDHMSVPILAGQILKHFNAVCTASRWNVAQVYSRATANTASDFIKQVVDQMPFKVSRIQVDGGSEFMADFETACHDLGIELAVLAPKSPKLNGNVERINGTWRTDFYELYDLPTRLDELRPMVAEYQNTYNCQRPHDSLSLQTPKEFLHEKTAA